MRANWLVACGLVSALVLAKSASAQLSQPVVPGTGTFIASVGDNLEDDSFKWLPYNPKASKNIDENPRLPVGRSNNGRWRESSYRGQPDLVKWVETPPGGIDGSQGSLLIRTFWSGVPGVATRESQQDDLVVNCAARLGGPMPVSWTPSCTVRVYLPPFEEWENRTGSSFAFRGDVVGHNPNPKRGLFGIVVGSETEPYWPGLFIQFQSETDRRYSEDSAYFILRAGPRGEDFRGPDINQLGWWTLGMSYTPDGRVHYYASPGVDELTEDDYISSQFCYSFRCQQFKTFYFNVFNANDGRNWSTEWIIDDPSLYLINTQGIAQRRRAHQRR